MGRSQSASRRGPGFVRTGATSITCTHARVPRPGLEEPRKSRPASAALIARKLMLLDCVVGEADVTWYAPNTTRWRCSPSQFGCLSRTATARVRGRKRPTTARSRDTSRTILRCTSTRCNRAPGYLAMMSRRRARAIPFDHALLIPSSAAVAVVCSATGPPRAAPGAEAAFRRCVSPVATATKGSASLARHFHVRRAVDQGELANVSVAELYAFRAAQRRLSTPAVEQQYREWLLSGDQARAGHVPSTGVVPDAAPARLASRSTVRPIGGRMRGQPFASRGPCAGPGVDPIRR